VEHCAGLDVSLKEISTCVADRDGKTIARGITALTDDGIDGVRDMSVVR